MFNHERVMVIMGIPEASGLRKCCLGLGRFHFCFQPTTTTTIIIPSAAPPPPSPKMSSVEQIEAELKLVHQRLELARKKKEEEERAVAEEARRVKEAAERKAREEAEAVAREEKARAMEWMAEAVKKQHVLAVLSVLQRICCRKL
jgi:hypothetical protein